MTYILIILCIITITTCIKLEFNKLAKKIILLYVCFSFGCLIFSSMNLMNIDKVSYDIYLMWLINILIFVSAIILLSTNEIKEFDNNNLDKTIIKIIKSKTLKIISLIFMVILLYYTIKYFHIIKNIDKSLVRISRFTMLFDSPLEIMFYSFIVNTFSYINISILAILIISNRFFTKQGIISVINMLLFFMVGFGRLIIYDFLVILIFAFIIKNINKKVIISKKNIIKMFTIIILIFIIGVLAVLARLDIKGENLIVTIILNVKEQIKHIIIYFTGAFRMLDRFVHYGFEEISGYTYGRSSFAGIDDLLGLSIRGLGFNYNILNRSMGIPIQKFIMIGPSIQFNAFYSCVMNYYMDFGLLGIFIFPIIHGIGVFLTIKNFLKRKDVWSMILLLIVLNIMLNSIFVWEYQSGGKVFLVIILILLNFIFNNKNKNKMLKESNIK